MGNPVPMDRPPPVCPLIFRCTENDPSIHLFRIPVPLELIISGMSLVPLIYFIRCANFFKSLLSGSLTLVVRKAVDVHVLGLALLVAYKVFATTL